MRITAVIVTGLIYALSMASVVYLIVFVSGDMVDLPGAHKTLNSGDSFFGNAASVWMNIGLLLLFGVQHSVMARPGFKRVCTKIIPAFLERSFYLLATTIVLVLLYAGWQPIPAVVWSVDNDLLADFLAALSLAGFGLAVLSTFQFNHFEMFGLQQGWNRFRERASAAIAFKIPFLYRIVRHPLYLGFLIAFWSAPVMTAGHLLFAAIWTAYIFIALGYEERDLLDHFGEKYREYMAKVPMILPIGKRR